MRSLFQNLPILLGMFSLILMPACSKTTGPSTGTIVVTVVDEAANPLAGATLTLTPGDIVRTSDSAGAATFSEIEKGDYSIRACLTDFDDCISSVIVTAGKTTEKTLTMSMCTGDLLFIVLDADSLAVAGALITIQPGDESRTTGMDAKALFENCTIGSYTYTIQGSGFDDITGTVEVTADETVTREVRISFLKGSISVYVRESYVDSLVANIWVQVERTDGVPTLQGATDATGRWTSPQTRVGTATVSVASASQLTGTQAEVEIQGNQTTSVVLKMNRSESRLSGEIALSFAPPAQYDHDIGLYKYVASENAFYLVDSYSTRQYYTFNTSENEFLAAVLWSTYQNAEFYLCWSPIIDTRSGHLKVTLPRLESAVTNQQPWGTWGDLTFPKTIWCNYSENGAQKEIWSIYILEWNDTTNQWDGELSWNKEETDINGQVTWNGVFNKGSYSGESAFYDDQDHWYAWDLAVLYYDGRYSESFSYTFSFEENPSLTRSRVESDRKAAEVIRTSSGNTLPSRIIRP